jgi:hypothetical protein
MSRDALEEIIEPCPIQQGFVSRTPRGRVLTAHAFATSAWCRRRAARRSSGCLKRGSRGMRRLIMQVYEHSGD